MLELEFNPFSSFALNHQIDSRSIGLRYRGGVRLERAFSPRVVLRFGSQAVGLGCR